MEEFKMKAYGVNHKYDQCCCPGHDKYPCDTYENNRSKRAQTRDTAKAHRAERRRVKQILGYGEE